VARTTKPARNCFAPHSVLREFHKDQIEAHSQRLMRRNQSRQFEYVLFQMQPPSQRASAASY